MAISIRMTIRSDMTVYLLKKHTHKDGGYSETGVNANISPKKLKYGFYPIWDGTFGICINCMQPKETATEKANEQKELHLQAGHFMHTEFIK